MWLCFIQTDALLSYLFLFRMNSLVATYVPLFLDLKLKLNQSIEISGKFFQKFLIFSYNLNLLKI